MTGGRGESEVDDCGEVAAMDDLWSVDGGRGGGGGGGGG